jgi:hypothetical protein
MAPTFIQHEVPHFCNVLARPQQDVVLKQAEKHRRVGRRLDVHRRERAGVLRVDPCGGLKGLRKVVEGRCGENGGVREG